MRLRTGHRGKATGAAGQMFIKRCPEGWVGLLYSFAAMGIVLAMAVAADYGIGPVYAAAVPVTQPVNVPGSAAQPAAGQALNASPVVNAPNHPIFTPSTVPIGAAPDPGFKRLPGHVLDAVHSAKIIARTNRSGRSRLTLTVTLNRDDPLGFEQYLNDAYDPTSKQYGKFLTQAELAAHFGPSRSSYSRLEHYLQGRGFKVIARSKNRLTMTVTARRRQVEQAFAIRINDYQLGERKFYANDADPAVPAALAPAILGIQGFSDLARPERIITWIYPGPCNKYGPNGADQPISLQCQQYLLNFCAGLIVSGTTLAFGPNILAGVVALDAGLGCLAGVATIPTSSAISGEGQHLQMSHGVAASAVGAGQTIGLLEFDNYNQSDVVDFLALIGAPSSQISNLSEFAVNGGTTPGANQDEVLLDVDMVLSGAPGAKVVVYDAPFTGQAASYTALFNAMLNGGVTIISNSWASCEDQITAAEAQSIDSVLQSAAAGGVSVFNGAGDSGSTCLDGSANTVAVPADSPSATAVGGSSPTYGPGFTYGSESWWNGTSNTPPTGQGGFGVSKFFAEPSYQKSVFASAGRSVPDVVAEADPAEGFSICEAAAGGCPTGFFYGGTSLATPIWAVYAAALNQDLGRNLGSFNPLIYPLAATAAFHNAASLGSDTAHVGLGSASLGNLKTLLSHQTVGVPSSTTSQSQPLLPAASISSGALPADGSTQGGVLVTLLDANHNLVSGKTVTLTANGGSAVITPTSGVTSVSDGAVAFTVTDLKAESLTFTATDTTDGIILTQKATLKFVTPPAASAGITANPPTVTADGSSAATITVTLTDSLNRPTPGKTISLSDGGAHAVIDGPSPAVTDANGRIQFSVTDQLNETVTFSAVDVTDGNLPFPGTATVTYSNSTATACDVALVPVAASGYSITPYITGVPASPSIYFGNVNWSCSGANGPAFAPSGAVLESDFVTGGVYQTGPSGGNVSSANLLSNLGLTIANFVFTPDGKLYATQKATTGDFTTGDIIQVDPTTGASLRVVASGLICPSSLAVDPLSGDLFFDDECSGAGSNNASLFRLIDPAGTDASRPTSVVTYTTLPSSPNGAIAFAPNGTIYVLAFGSPSTVEQVSPTNSATVTVSQVPGITPNSGLAIGATHADGSAQSLIVDPAGVLSEVSIANPSQATVLATVSPGVGVTGPDGCLYSAHYDTVYRLANSTGACNFTPTSPAPSLSLTPATVTPNPAQGSSRTFTATLKNVATLAGNPVYFKVSGANPQIKLATTNAGGAAAISYTAAQEGVDTVVASATGNGVALNSNSVQLKWTAGKHVTFVSLNSSPQGGTVNVPVTVTATLSDVSANPATSLAGQTITLTLGSSSCTATTNSNGAASCSLTPSSAGTTPLTASFAGSSTLAAAAQSVGFNVSLAPTPPPTVSLAVSPTTLAAGFTATLTWSSSNATACTASGSWSGSEATSGSLAVTPATNGSYSYTLTCTGAGGTAAATAELAATRVSVTVTAKSGGGAITWTMLLVLGLLVLGRIVTLRSTAGLAIAVFSLLILALAHSARADSPGTALASGAAQPTGTAQPTATADSGTPDGFYDGIRVGAMTVRQSASRIDAGLAARGFGDVSAQSDTMGAAGTVFVGYEFLPHTAVELAYSLREAPAANLSGTIPSTARLTPLLQTTTGLIRGYGSIVSVSYAGHFEVLPRFNLEPRLGGFFWATKVSAIGFDDRIDSTHEGGGVTAGVSAVYRLWRGLEAGLNVDYYRGSPSNNATLYGGTFEWRFGHP